MANIPCPAVEAHGVPRINEVLIKQGPPPGFRVTLGIKAFGVAKILVRSPEVLVLTHCYPPRPPEGPRMGAPRGGGGVVPC